MANQQRLLRDVFAAYRGEEIDTQGDSFFVAFRSAADAVSAAVAVQRALAAHEWPDGAQVRVRVGIHTGEAAAAGERYVHPPDASGDIRARVVRDLLRGRFVARHLDDLRLATQAALDFREQRIGVWPLWLGHISILTLKRRFTIQK